MEKIIKEFLNIELRLRKFNVIIGYERNAVSRLLFLTKRKEDVIYIPAEEGFSLLILQALENVKNKQIIIEDPEAHLFPTLHKKIVFDIAKICNTSNKSVIITTNSPYILSAFNILLLANNIMNEKNKEKIEKIIGRNTAIKFEDIEAYTIEDGILKSFLNHENKLLDTNIIDKATEELENLFDKINEIGLD